MKTLALLFFASAALAQDKTPPKILQVDVEAAAVGVAVDFSGGKCFLRVEYGKLPPTAAPARYQLQSAQCAALIVSAKNAANLDVGTGSGAVP